MTHGQKTSIKTALSSRFLPLGRGSRKLLGVKKTPQRMTGAFQYCSLTACSRKLMRLAKPDVGSSHTVGVTPDVAPCACHSRNGQRGTPQETARATLRGSEGTSSLVRRNISHEFLSVSMKSSHLSHVASDSGEAIRGWCSVKRSD